MKSGAQLIAEERTRQIEQEGWTADHDDQYREDELIRAAVCYMAAAVGYGGPLDEVTWPFPGVWWKPGKNDPVRCLAKAGALIAAEIDRRLRETEECPTRDPKRPPTR